MRRAERLPVRYDVSGELGEGAMGVVYRAWDQERSRELAVKTFKRDRAQDLYRLKREFRTLSEIRHRNLVELYDLIVPDEGACFYSMELVHGVDPRAYCRSPPRRRDTVPAVATTLSLEGLGQPGAGPSNDVTLGEGDLAPREGTPSTVLLGRVRHVLSEICAGVSAIHGAGKLHRDLKCSNVLVTEGGQVKILDFGLVLDLLDASRDSMAGVTVGTLGYMSPEQAMASSSLTPASDVYAIGSILFELLTGELPFSGTIMQVMAKKLQSDAPSVLALDEALPEDLAELCADMLRRDPLTRPGLEEVRRRLSTTHSLQSALAVDGSLLSADEQSQLLGRDIELGMLSQDLISVRAGEPRVRVVEAPSGLGKTVLIRHALRAFRAEWPELVVIEGKCRDQELVKFRALDEAIDSLSALWRSLPDGEASAILPRGADALPALFPVLGSVRAVAETPPNASASAQPDELRRRAIEALREVLVRLCERRPVVLFIDDFQWADEESKALLWELLLGENAPKLLVLLSQRPGVLDSTRAWADDLEERLRVSELAPLSPADVAALCRAQNDALDEHTIARVVEESGGSPMFAVELARHLTSGEATAAATLQEAIAARLAQTLPATQTISKLVSLCGQPIHRDVLFSAARLDKAQGMVALEEAMQGRFVRALPSSGGKLIETFHEQVRESLRLSLTAGERRHWHREIALALQQAKRLDNAALAEHWHAASEHARAAQYYRKAAREARNRLDFVAEAALLGQVLELGAAASGDGTAIAALEEAYARALTFAGRRMDAAEAFLRAAQSHSEPLSLRTEAAGLLLATGQLQRGTDVAASVMRELGLRMPKGRIEALLQFVYYDLRLRISRLKLRPAPKGLSRALLERAFESCIQFGAGFNVAAPWFSAAFSARAAFLASRLGDEERFGMALGGHAAVLGLFSPAAGRRMAERSIALTSKSVEPRPQLYALLAQLSSSYFLSNFRQTLSLAKQAEALFAASAKRFPFEEERIRMLGAFARAMLGEYRYLWEMLHPLLRDMDRRGETFAAAQMRTALGWPLHILHDHPERLANDRATLARVERYPGDFLSFYECLAVAYVGLYTREPDEALALLNESELPLVRTGVTRNSLGRTFFHCLRAELRICKADVDESLSAAQRDQLLDEAERDLRRISREAHPYARGQGACMMGALAAMRGEKDAAIEWLAKGQATSRAIELTSTVMGAQWLRGGLLGGAAGAELQREAERWARSEGARKPRRFLNAFVYSPSTIPSLTSDEGGRGEVARGTGEETNPENNIARLK